MKEPKYSSKIECSELISFAQKYFKATTEDKHSRYHSCEHCYSFFQERQQNPSKVQKEFLCIHLAWLHYPTPPIRNKDLLI